LSPITVQASPQDTDGHGSLDYFAYVGSNQEIDNLFTEIANTQEFEGISCALALAILLHYKLPNQLAL